AESPEKTQLHNLSFSRIENSQLVQCVVEGDNVGIGLLRHLQGLIPRHLHRPAASFQVLPGASEIGEYATHHLCGNSKKMGPVLPTHLLDVNQPQINL